MLRKSYLLYFLLIGVLLGCSLLAQAQATLDFAFIPVSPVVNEEITFTAEVVTGDPTWFILYEWDFDQDGTYDDTGNPVVHEFPAAGTYPVTLRATDDRGGFHTVIKNVVVTNDPPVAGFTYAPAPPDAGESVLFDSTPSYDLDGTLTRFEWDFNTDGVVDAVGRTSRYTFATAGQHPVTLTVYDDGGAWDSQMQWVTVQPVLPVAEFTHAPTDPTVYDTVQFQDTSYDPDGGQIIAWHWTFGDGATSTLQNPTHQYLNGGTYSVTLRITDDDQQVRTSVPVLIDVAGPSAAFTYTPLQPTTQDPVQFFDQSGDPGGDIISWAWDFGDGGDSSLQNPLHTFTTAGVYPVQLTVTSDGGATSATMRTVVVGNSAPEAEFTFTPSEPNVDQSVTFSAGGSSDPDGHIVAYEWDMNNDGITDMTGSTVTHAFDTVGAHPVRLKVTDNEGAVDYKTKVVPVQSTPPVASFTFTPETPNTGQSIAFDASGSSDADGTIILYEWDFDDDGVTDKTGMSSTYSYPAAGVYAVTLTVTDDDGAVDAQTKGVPVQVGGTSGDNQAPEAEFTFEPADGTEANINEVITFRAEGSSDPDGSIVAYEWDFDNDGAYDATGATVQHIYQTGGAKIVTLRVMDNDGAAGFATRVVAIVFSRPTADFTYDPEEPEVGEVVTFDGSPSTDHDGTVEFFEWDFDGDGETDATGQSVTYAFDEGGSTPVTLKVTDDDGVTDYVTKTVRVIVNSPPIADFSHEPIEPTVGESVKFLDESVDSDGRIVSWYWEFGDGGTSAVQSPSHTYTESGVYGVSLKVTDDHGDTDQAEASITVAPQELNSHFTYTPANPEVGEDIQFTDQSTGGEGGIEEWSWTFGDGTTSSVQNPVHAYSSTGNYTVTLTVTDASGQSDEYSDVVSFLASAAFFAYPNPAGSQATFDYELDGATNPVLRIYDIRGRLVLEEELSEGRTTYTWNLETTGGDPVPNGVYYCIILAEDEDGRTTRIGDEPFRLLVERR